MKRTVLLACLMGIAVVCSRAGGQDAGNQASPPDPPPPPQMALAAMRIAGDVAPEQAFQSVERLRDAMVSMGRFESLDDTDSVAALVRLVVTTASIGPGATVVITEVEPDPQDPTKARDIHIAATISVDGGVNVDRLLGATPDPKHGGIVFISQKDSVVELCFQKIEFKGDFLQPDTLDAFASHAGEVAGGMELMLDLENLRRAWPQSLADGPARRVIAVTGLANARKIHVHVPESGAVRLAYSSRALPAEDVSTRTGPAPAGESEVGVRWPAVFDAGLRTYAVALEDEPREAFARKFQDWMSVNGGRLRGIIQAVEIAMDWSVSRTADDGFRTEVSAPVRRGIEKARLIEAVKATLANTGFEVEGNRGELALPDAFASAVGGQTLAIEVDDTAEPVVMKITIE